MTTAYSVNWFTFQPLNRANLENLECLNKRSQKPGDWHLKSGDFQNLCQMKKKKKGTMFLSSYSLPYRPCHGFRRHLDE